MSNKIAGIDPEKTENLEDIEKQFAVVAVEHMETYWKILKAVRGSTLQLTKIDDQIYNRFAEKFPEMNTAAALQSLNEQDMKSPKGKELWRNFAQEFEKLDNYNFGTLLRTRSDCKYDERTTMFSVRIQFLAIEIARNKFKLNDWIYEAGHPEETATRTGPAVSEDFASNTVGEIAASEKASESAADSIVPEGPAAIVAKESS